MLRPAIKIKFQDIHQWDQENPDSKVISFYHKCVIAALADVDPEQGWKDLDQDLIEEIYQKLSKEGEI